MISPRAVQLPFAVVLVLASSACRREATPAVIAAEQVPAVIQHGFATASGEAKALSEAVATALKENNTVEAWAALNQMNQRSDLTAEQHEAATKSQRALMIKLQAAAAGGDAQARQLVEAYQATK